MQDTVSISAVTALYVCVELEHAAARNCMRCSSRKTFTLDQLRPSSPRANTVSMQMLLNLLALTCGCDSISLMVRAMFGVTGAAVEAAA